MTDRPLRGTICTGDDLSSPVRYEFFAPPDFWVDDAVIGMFVELAFPTRFTECGTITCDEAAAAFSGILDSVKRSAFMIGCVIPFATTDPPPGTLRCDGTTYQRVDYPDLYAVLGAAYILNANQFYTPDCRAKVVAGSGNYDGVDFDLYNFIGESQNLLEITQMPAHDHSIDLFVTSLALAPGELPVQTDVIFNTVTGSTGDGQPHNNIQPSIVLDYCIIAR